MDRIGYLSAENPFKDRRAWSGTLYKIREAIENAGYEVVWVRYSSGTILDHIIGAYCKIRYGRNHSSSCWSRHFWLCSKSVDRKAMASCDYLFCPWHNANLVPFLKNVPPVISYNDCTAQLMNNYYYFNQHKKYLKSVNDLERESIRQSALTIRSSFWAADSVVKHYGGANEKTVVLLFGANLDECDIAPNKCYSGGTLNLFFSGVQWERKRGDVAVEAVKELVRRGYDAKLWIAGVKKLSKAIADLPFVENIGYLNKNNREEYERYIEIWKKSHICIVPTRAECAGIVFAEAAGFGIPVFTCDTGGVGDYVINGVNGYRLSISASGLDFAERIARVIESRELPALRRGALKRYESEISWKAWSRKFRELMDFHFPDSLHKV